MIDLAKVRTLIILCLIYLSWGCFVGDSFNPITITNTTKDTIVIQLRESTKFHTEKEKITTTADGFSVYKLPPLSSFNIGNSINEIDDDIPFSELRVISNNDTLLTNHGNAKILFDKNTFGRIKRPYNISINKSYLTHSSP